MIRGPSRQYELSYTMLVLRVQLSATITGLSFFSFTMGNQFGSIWQQSLATSMANCDGAITLPTPALH